MTTILTIDDEPQIRRFLRISLTSQGFDVIEAEDGRTGLAQAALAKPDLVILDLGLPDLDGKEVLRQLLVEQPVPVLVLSVRSSELEKVTALDMGAEDYVVKPFSVNELLARVRRILASRGPATSVAAEPGYQDDRLLIDTEQHRLLCDGQTVNLTRKEWAVLSRLIQSPGRLVTQSSLLESIWGKTHRDDTQYLRNVIRQLRLKLGDDAANPYYLETEPGVGYRFLDRRC
ncbi:response regulator [Saccharospirillum salsuginis]|uniref:DNA-binding response regulator n=1 Tax=Saccharospirillum salsuginis TaxID=418750 RepID=A0A918N900_9GAMM|nr:response regulator transcription factor [Saccharospirillum salsuginis]GGX48907.1 DNA-binding response regulator [Saccharospirillum salsuginis]